MSLVETVEKNKLPIMGAVGVIGLVFLYMRSRSSGGGTSTPVTYAVPTTQAAATPPLTTGSAGSGWSSSALAGIASQLAGLQQSEATNQLSLQESLAALSPSTGYQTPTTLSSTLTTGSAVQPYIAPSGPLMDTSNASTQQVGASQYAIFQASGETVQQLANQIYPNTDPANALATIEKFNPELGGASSANNILNGNVITVPNNPNASVINK